MVIFYSYVSLPEGKSDEVKLGSESVHPHQPSTDVNWP